MKRVARRAHLSQAKSIFLLCSGRNRFCLLLDDGLEFALVVVNRSSPPRGQCDRSEMWLGIGESVASGGWLARATGARVGGASYEGR